MKEATFEQKYSAIFDRAGKVKNYTKAFPLLVVAAKNGHPHAQNLVGYCYDLGLGVERNHLIAALWFGRAAKKNHIEAICNLALLHSAGSGVNKNETKAFWLIHQAANMGDAWAQ